MAQNASELWNECLSNIRQRLSATQYTTFFEPIKFESYNEQTRTLVLQAPSKAHVGYLENSFLPLLSEVLGNKFGQIQLQYRTVIPVANKKKAIANEGIEEKASTTIATNLHPHYTFTTFIEGESNKLARSVGITIAEHPRKTSFNPMFVFGPSGCGKTHLINAIGNLTCSRYPKKKVLYVGAREFQRQYTDSVRTKETNDFIHFYQQFDLLIVDDVQGWESSPKTSETFFHIFNHLFMNGRRIILAADRTPAELKNMDERMLTRFNCGILCELEKPNHKLCVDILNAKINRDGLTIPSDVVEYIASTANGSVRDLEGVVNSLLAHSIFLNGDIDMELAERVVSRLKKDTPKQYDVNSIIDVVCSHFSIDVEDVLGKSRKREYVQARQISMYLLQKLAKISINRIGRLIGNRDHSTVAHGIDKITKMMKTDKALIQNMKTIERNLKAGKK
jgi:chromosomal replication initiator protein